MLKDKYAPGEPCWIDLGTDIPAAIGFYGPLFGWEFADAGPDAGGYHMASHASNLVAGLGVQQNPGPPTWNVYFCTHDLGRSVELVRSNGGTVLVEAVEVMAAGDMAVCADPQGAVFSFWRPHEMHGFAEVDASGTFCWAELVTSDTDAAAAFYSAVFGWGAQPGDDPAMPYVEFQLGVTSIAGMMPRPDMMPAEAPNYWGVYFAVDDTDDAVARAAALGGSTLAGPMDVSVGRFATCADPQGAIYSVIAMGPTP